MSEKTNQKPVKCGCGGEAKVEEWVGRWYVRCQKSNCLISTKNCDTEAEAIRAWNTAMNGLLPEGDPQKNVGVAITNSTEPERKKGRWIYDTERVWHDGGIYAQYHCSECRFQVIGSLYNYCPFCGADMRGGR